jgi:hypothetical protein
MNWGANCARAHDEGKDQGCIANLRSGFTEN